MRSVARPIAPGSGAFVALIASLTAVTAMSIDINLPAIPQMATTLGTSLTAAQLTITLFFLGFALGQVVWGPLSDRYGRRPVLLWGLALYVLTTLGCALAGGIEMLLALRVAQGFAAGCGPVLGRAIVRDLFEGSEVARILSLVMAAFILAPIIAPTVGALLLSVGSWRLIFLFLALYGVVILFLARRYITETNASLRPDALRLVPLVRALTAVFADRRSRPPALICVLVGGVLNVFLVNASAVFMVGYGLSPSMFGLVFALSAACQAAASLLNSRLVTILPLYTVIGGTLAVGLVTSLLACIVAFTGWGGVPLLVAAFAAYLVTFGLCITNGITLALLPHPQITGTASAALGFAQSVVPSIIGGVVALLFDGTARPMAVTFLLLTVASLLVLLTRPKT